MGSHHRLSGGALSGARGEPVDPNLRQLLERQAARLGDRPFVTLQDGTLSFAAADELANRMAWVLAARGVAAGDVVMARCANRVAMVATWLGCNKLGAVYMPLNSLLTGEPLLAVMALTNASVVICDAEGSQALAPLADRLANVRHVLVAGGGEGLTKAAARPGTGRVGAPGGDRSGAYGAYALASLDALLDQAPSSAPPSLVDDPGAPAKLMCTSGTTGVPKGVVWSRACEALWAAAYGDELLPIEEGEGLYSCLPLFHVTCQGTTLAALRRGGHMTIGSRFDPFGFWRQVRSSGAVAFSFVGTLLAVLANRPRQPDDADNQLRWILGSAAPVDRWQEIEERFGVSIVETWGQTETAACWTAPAGLPQRPGTIGRPSARFEARIVRPDGSDAPDGEEGEMHMRPLGPHVMFEGYLVGPTPPAEPTPGSPPRLPLSREGWTGDGWYRTGDLMVRRPDGDLSFAGRLRESIRRRGEIIPARLVEAAALEHRLVAEAAAVGVPDDDGVEQEVKLCVVAIAGAQLEPGELHSFVRQRLPKFMVPRYVQLRDAFPKTPTTRIRRVALSEESIGGVWDSRHPGRPTPANR